MRKAVRSRPDPGLLAAERPVPARGAWTLPLLAHGPTRAVGGDGDDDGGTVAWIAAGTAFQVRAFVPSPAGRGYLMLEAAAGQATLASHEPDEAAVLDVLARRHGRPAVEQVLCGDGVQAMYRAVCELRGERARRIGLASLIAHACAARDPNCSRALAMFCGLLGDVAGHVALTLGAGGGVVIAGEIVDMLGDWFPRSPFRRRFEARGRCRDTLRAIPTVVAGRAAQPRPATG
ncbi:MAG TPA: glucokinase [Burkholderiaceae bacterium]